MTDVLAAREIEVRYEANREPILSGLTLELRAGEIAGVIGPNGSGKSTLVRALSRALRPESGAVLLDDNDLYGQVSARRSAQRVGVVPQSAVVTFDFTVREIVRMGRDPHLPPRPFAGESAADERIVDEALAATGVTDLADRFATTLSGGEWQRVLLARALAQHPDVLLLDEPTAHLDIRHQWDVLALARSLAQQGGKAVLAVLHDLNLAAAFCDRLILLSQGRIVADGSPAEVLTPEYILAVYGTPVHVLAHPVSGRPYILPPTASGE
jgi:iron complex transport system ATP-binding protein